MDLFAGILLLSGLGCAAALLLVPLASRFRTADDEVVTLVNSVLPQTQCAQCGYPGCRPYAQAIVDGEAINRCPPGGGQTINALANLLGRDVVPLDEEVPESMGPAVAVIREDECIGCTLCIAACPVDAIVGAPQLMHTVIEDMCTGCDLCREPCPVDCIDLVAQTNASIDVEFLFEKPDQPCINCGLCIPACPKSLSPQLLYWYRSDMDKALSYDLLACIECGRCDRVCPSDLPLTRTFALARRQYRQLEAEKAEARETEKRYLRREARLNDREGRVQRRPSVSDKSSLLAQIEGDSERDEN